VKPESVNDLAERLARLSPEQQALFELKLKKLSASESPAKRLSRRATGNSAPLSFAQQRIWFLSQLAPDSSAYNQSKALRLTGELSLDALENALDGVVARHEVLRTVISAGDDHIVQVIRDPRHVELPVIDLGELAESERETEAQRLLKEITGRPFDLTQDLMLRAAVLRLEQKQHILLLVTHHIASDGWSRSVLWREIAALYRASISGEPASLTEFPVQYADYAIWQRQWLQGDALAAQLTYWKAKLADVAALDLPTDRPRPSIQSYNGGTQFILLPQELSIKLKTFSRQESVTLFMTLLAVFQTLLYRYTGQEDIAVGTPIANRKQLELEGLIGFFVNTLVLRSDLSGEPTFRTLLARVKKTALSAYDHQDLPFEKLVEELNPERELSRQPLFQVTFQIRNDPSESLTLPGIEAEPYGFESGMAKFDLSLSMIEDASGTLSGSLEYNTDLFEHGTIKRLLGHFQELLAAIAADPEQRISEIPLLTKAEKHQLLVEWNATKKKYPKEKCVHDLFEAQVDTAPNAVAVIFEDKQLTYRELNRRANQLARYLIKLGVGPETLVAVCMERSVEMVAGLLAILKAGAAYVPVDPSYPKERIGFMLEDARARVVLTQQRLLENLPQHGARVVCLDDRLPELAQQSHANLDSEVMPNHLAYVIYTSGSTGKPKGVMIPHSAVANHMLWMQEAFPLTGADRVLQKTTFGFDAAVWEFYAPLLAGAVLVMAPHEHNDAASWVKLVAEQQITVLQVVPSVLRVFFEQAGLDSCHDLRRLYCGGELLSRDLAERLSACLPRTELYNLYGPTEATIDALCGVRNTHPDRDRVPIGRPISNVQVYLLDAHLNAVPIGIAGELYLGGAGLARGYLDRPDLTSEKFLPNPFSNEPGARLYRTGDLCRYLPDGNIEFLGRVDHQVKIRGFRIEPGEIESVLGQHPGVQHAVVLAREDDPGKRRLVAYVMATENPPPAAHELRGFVRAKLPEYMVPSAFVFLEALPLTPNGKLNRKALPTPDQCSPELERNFVVPRTAMEERIAEIWAQVLSLGKIGIHDNFFELGGHSLLAMQALSRLRQAFGSELSLRVFFDRPTVSALAEYLEQNPNNECGMEMPAMLPGAREKYVPLSFAQQRLWFLDQLEPGSSAYHLSGMFRLSGPLLATALEHSLNEIIRRHESLRTTFVVVGDQPVQVIAPSLTVPLLVFDFTGPVHSDREEEARQLLAEEARRRFDLARGPLLRAILVRLGEREHQLLLTLHHIISDGWSMGVLYRELSILYDAFCRGEGSPLPELTQQYADFTLWQRAWLQGEILESQVSYWKQQLEGAPAILSLPKDRPASAAQSSRAARHSLELSEELAEGLIRLSRREGATLYMTLLAAFQTLLHRHTGQEDIVVGSPIANRNRSEIEELIGFFVNTLVLRSKFSGAPTFKELLTQVKELALGAYAHQDLPFEKLVEEIHPQRSLHHTPLFQVLFNMINPEDAQIELRGLTVERMVSSSGESKFDMTLYVRQQDNRISLSLVYRVELFDDRRMIGFLQQYRHLLEQIAAAPEKPIRDYSLVTPESRALLPDPRVVLTEPPHPLVAGTVLSWAERTPAHAAIRQGQQTWSYDELRRCADSLARLVVAGGLAPKDVIAVYGQPSFGLIAAMIAVFLSGGVLLPLDCSLPRQRMQRMLREARAKKLLYAGAKRHDDAWLEEEFGPDILFIGAREGRPLGATAAPVLDSIALPQIDGGDPAYIFFTSGTTGVPKGVLGCHKGLSHFLNWQRETFAIGPGDRVSQLTGLSFDAVLRDIFLPLTSGATLCLRDIDDSFAPGEIVRWLERQQVTVLHAVPSLAQSWLACGDTNARLESMRWVFFLGEPLTEAFVRQWRAAFPNNAEIVNLYGPTETTLVKCFYRVPVDARPGVQPVGRPIPNTQALVLNDHRQLCGINEPGEIVLRTPFRTLGYVNCPEENQQRFVKNPFRDDAEDLIYFTGDAGCYQPDGTLQILGRRDDEIKIHGVRMEPAEVTAILARHPSIDACVVAGKKNDRQESYLAAYAVPAGEEKLTAAALTSYLLEQLPTAMVPSVFVFMDALPLTPNGKIDRKALPEPEHHTSPREESYIAPRTGTESVLAAIWAEVLKLQRVGVRDNFFELGGHSLLATQIVSRTREALQVDVALRALFEKPTVASLSEHLEAIRRVGEQDQSRAAAKAGETEEVIL
jgi:amino acid adenylation domain-containing protein